jgi:hypothetical protein
MDPYLFVLLLIATLGTLLILFFLVRAFVLKKEIAEIVLKSEEMKSLFRAIQLKLNRLQNELSDMEINPEENVLEGLKGAGIGQILEALKVNPEMVISLLPAKYKMFAPLVKGFLEGLSKQGGGKPGAQAENSFRSQTD